MAHNSTNGALFYVTSCYLALEDHKLHALARHVRARALAQEISIALDPRFARSTLAGGGRREAGGGRGVSDPDLPKTPGPKLSWYAIV